MISLRMFVSVFRYKKSEWGGSGWLQEENDIREEREEIEAMEEGKLLEAIVFISWFG